MFWMMCSIGVIVYSVAVLNHVMSMGTIGVRCMFGTTVQEDVDAAYYEWSPVHPVIDDELVRIADEVIQPGSYADYIHALRSLSQRLGQDVPVEWRDGRTGQMRFATARVKNPPEGSYFWSWVWFGQELLIFAIGAWVFWKRPNDDSVMLFFVMCITTVGAYMGGYHWTEIVFSPFLIYLFAFFAVFMPVVNLHFYLIFPRVNPVLAKRRRLVLGGLYGFSTIYLLLLWSSMFAARWTSRVTKLPAWTKVAFEVLRGLALAYIGLAAILFGLCIVCLVFSFRNARTRAERSQVRWILPASVIALGLIGYLLIQACNDPATLGRDNAAWPMFGVSLLFTVAHAFSITRYKLMEVEDIINRSVVYFAFTLIAGLIYSGLLVAAGALIGDQLLSPHSTTRGAIVFAFSVVVVLILFEVARGRFQRVIDRRFFREKYKLEQAMHKMKLAVGSLVDRSTLGRRLLEAAAEVLRLEWGALYLGESPGQSLQLAASHGPAPDQRTIGPDHALFVRLRQTPTVRLSHAPGLPGGSDPATDAMIALGGEAAAALGGDGQLLGILILGPKRSGMPYEDEEMAFLGALGSVAAMVLHSADIQRTLEGLNVELRDKVEKIAEQQRRILILQEQLRERAGRERDELVRSGRGTELAVEGGSEPGVFEAIRGSSDAVRKMIAMARKVSASPSAVLIRGESGTGKELLAAAIHAGSPRAARPFVKVHCAALSQTLLESELFGHVKGAYTNADRDRVGRFEMADGGTLFLDEIGDINLEVQTKLLRVLQEMSFERVGSSQPISVDVRILAATHQDLESLIRAGRFREDLYYRLNVICLTTPPLRERREDIFELAVYFLKMHAERTGKMVTHLEPEAVEALVSHDWPGNIRELENVLERAVVLADGPSVTLGDLPPEVRQPGRRRFRPRLPVLAAIPGGAVPGVEPATAPGIGRSEDTAARGGPWASPSNAGGASDEWSDEFPAYERQRLLDALSEADGNKSVAARILGMPRSTFFSKLKKYGIV
jgi:transcriptional regulator with GAF, ATPase, and Fis domain